ncbi:MAG: alkaline phosphatase family protein [Solirubrobacterales bacterium]
MSTGKESGGGGPPRSCSECGTPFGADQRYCLSCGARRGEMPAAVAAIIAARTRAARGTDPAAAAAPPGAAAADAATGVGAAVAAGPVAAAAGAGPASADGGGAALDPVSEPPPPSYLPTPRAAAIAVLGMLGLGVLLGSATSELARSAGVAPIIVLSEPAPEQAPPEEEETVEYEEAPEEETVAAAPTEPIAEQPLYEEPLPEEPSEPEPEPEPELPELPEEPALPVVSHVFMIVLGDNGYEELFGERANSTYLSQTLAAEGELLTNYFAVTSGSLANQIALLSGQGPTPETALNCPTYSDLLPGTLSAEGQVEGNGCVYPAEAETLVSQLTEANKTWRAYVEDMDSGVAGGAPAACRHPALGTADLNQLPVSGDGYETWRNPFVYFHAIVDSPECEDNDVDLERLAKDLKKAKTTPNLAYIVPNACHSGGEVPCQEGAPTGALAVEELLKVLVPAIVESPAYEEGTSLIAITSAQAPQLGEHADSSACCGTPEYPNIPPREETAPATGPVKPSGGGGRVGLLLISPYVEPGTVREDGYYNHFTLLATIEELFELQPLGYAAEQLSFVESVLTASGEEESTVVERSHRRPWVGRALSRAISAAR